MEATYKLILDPKIKNRINRIYRLLIDLQNSEKIIILDLEKENSTKFHALFSFIKRNQSKIDKAEKKNETALPLGGVEDLVRRVGESIGEAERSAEIAAGLQIVLEANRELVEFRSKLSDGHSYHQLVQIGIYLQQMLELYFGPLLEGDKFPSVQLLTN